MQGLVCIRDKDLSRRGLCSLEYANARSGQGYIVLQVVVRRVRQESGGTLRLDVRCYKCSLLALPAMVERMTLAVARHRSFLGRVLRKHIGSVRGQAVYQHGINMVST